MELDKLLELSPDQIKELPMIEQLSYWTVLYEHKCIEVRKLIRDVEKNSIEKEETK